jgi:hypothetical protein
MLAAIGIGLMGATSPESNYVPGQVWEYHTRPGDEGSLLRIQKIEQLDKIGPVYHISIIGVHFIRAPLTSELQHLPVSRQTLDASVTRLSPSTVQFPDPSAGIDQWRAAHGGVFSIPVADIVSIIEQSVQARPQ